MSEGNVNALYPPTRSGTPADPHVDQEQELDSPGEYAFSITPSNDAELDVTIRGLYIGGAGNVFCRTAGASRATTGTAEAGNTFFYNVVAGTILPVRMDAVWSGKVGDISQNTTATFLVGLY